MHHRELSEALLLPPTPPLLHLREKSHLKGLTEASKEEVGVHRHGIGSAVILEFKFHEKTRFFFYFNSRQCYWV